MAHSSKNPEVFWRFYYFILIFIVISFHCSVTALNCSVWGQQSTDLGNLGDFSCHKNKTKQILICLIWSVSVSKGEISCLIRQKKTLSPWTFCKPTTAWNIRRFWLIKLPLLTESCFYLGFHDAVLIHIPSELWTLIPNIYFSDGSSESKGWTRSPLKGWRPSTFVPLVS